MSIYLHRISVFNKMFKKNNEMDSTLYLLLLSVCAYGMSEAFVPCTSPAAHVGRWIGINEECAALVQTNCHRGGTGSIGLTSTWKKGLHVKANCAQIPTLTAIATFLGPNGSYDEPHLHQHTAIFVKCETTGIKVWDQWNGTPIASRIIPWTGGSSPQYTGNNFWTIA